MYYKGNNFVMRAEQFEEDEKFNPGYYINVEIDSSFRMGSKDKDKDYRNLEDKRRLRSRTERNDFYRRIDVNFYVGSILNGFSDQMKNLIYNITINKYNAYLKCGGKGGKPGNLPNTYRYIITWIKEALEENNIDLNKTKIGIFMDDDDFKRGRAKPVLSKRAKFFLKEIGEEV